MYTLAFIYLFALTSDEQNKKITNMLVIYNYKVVVCVFEYFTLQSVCVCVCVCARARARVNNDPRAPQPWHWHNVPENKKF